MQDQNKKILRWILGGGLFAASLVIPEMLIAKLISSNNPDVYKSYAISMVFITSSIYLIVSVIKTVKYQKYVKNYKQGELVKASQELSTEFKQVLLNYSEPIPKDLFHCKAKIRDDGKIICKIQLDYEMKLKDYEDFLRFFHFDQE